MTKVTARPGGVDTAVRIVVPAEWADTVGAMLMEALGPYEEQDNAAGVCLVFFPPGAPVEPGAAPSPGCTDDILALLPAELRADPLVTVETAEIPRDWEEGWKAHFHPIVIGRVRIRPPWEPPLAPDSAASEAAVPPQPGLIEVVINPGMGFGTGLHPTTRGTLELLQRTDSRGALVDAGTGSGVLSVAAAKLRWGPIFAFDNDPVAIHAARENTTSNGVEAEIRLEDVSSVSLSRFSEATVLANMTLEPVTILLQRLGAAWRAARPAPAQVTPPSPEPAAPPAPAARLAPGKPFRLPRRIVVSGILAGEQERALEQVAGRAGLTPGARVYEAEWVSMELLPCEAPGEALDGAAFPSGQPVADGTAPAVRRPGGG